MTPTSLWVVSCITENIVPRPPAISTITSTDITGNSTTIVSSLFFMLLLLP